MVLNQRQLDVIDGLMDVKLVSVSRVECSVKKVFLKIYKTHRKTPVPEPFLSKVFAGLRP